MGEEMRSGQIWRKMIPVARDRTQSRVLAAVVGMVLAALSGLTLVLAWPMATRFPSFVLGSVAISVAFALVAGMLRATTPVGAVCGGMICLLLTYWTGSHIESIGRTALVPLALLFALTLLATRAGRQRKVEAGLAEGRRGRSAAQVIANLSMAALCLSPWVYFAIGRWMAFCCVSGLGDVWIDWTMKVMCLAALAEAAADTVSSEIGQAYGGAPVMLLTLQRVEPGADGAVTLLGTLAGVAAGLLVAIAGAWSMRLHLREFVVAAIAGGAGLFFDSLLGATVERRGWLGNDLVNFSSTLFAAFFAAMLYRWFVL
jgi:uncharacterized protein (TIGR00297 family)